jgi:PadR family transcriptional regulator AphA
VSLDAAILGFLSERPRSGYDLKTRCFDDALKGLWTADQAQIYRTLERLQTAKLVTSARKRQSGKPDRKVFSLTDLGRQTLSAWLDTDAPFSPPRDPFWLQLYFGASATDETLLARFLAVRSTHQKRLEGLRADATASAQDAGASDRLAALRDAAFSGAIAVERAQIDWIDDCIEGLRSGSLPAPQSHGERRALFGPSTA